VPVECAIFLTIVALGDEASFLRKNICCDLRIGCYDTILIHIFTLNQFEQRLKGNFR
jgi:hypothetical protein